MNKGILIKIFTVLIVFSGLLTSCVTKQKVLREPIKEQGADYLFNKLKENELKFKFLVLKGDINSEIDKESNSFSFNMRIKKDTLIWASISPAFGIEALRVLITPDSIWVMNRINKEYFKTTYEYVNQIMSSTFDFDMLQAFLVGNDFEYYDNTAFKASLDFSNYELSTIGRRKLRRYIETTNNLKLLKQKITLSPDNFKILKQTLEEKDTDRKLEVKYSDFESYNNQFYAKTLKCEVNSNKKMNLDISYEKIEVVDTLEFPFTIPSKYTKVKEKQP